MSGFTTANRMPAGGMHRVIAQQVLTEHTLELAFRAIAEATQEAVLNSLSCADDVKAADGRVFEGIGIGKYNLVQDPNNPDMLNAELLESYDAEYRANLLADIPA